MTTITTHTDSTFVPEARLVPSPVGRLAKPIAGLVVGVAIGWFAGSALADSPITVTEAPTAPAAVVATPSTPAEPRMSADAAERWAQIARQERIDACTSSASSADGLERCLATGGGPR